MTKSLMLRVWFGLFVAVIFAAGVGAGVMLAPRFAPSSSSRAGVPVRSPGDRGAFPRQPGMGPTRLAPQLAEELGLDAEQERQLDDVFKRRRERLEEIQHGVRDQFEAEQRALREEIRTILTEEQMAKFDEWLRRPRRGSRRPSRP
jgi:Spy/CpxP family protein refolding chaperone